MEHVREEKQAGNGLTNASDKIRQTFEVGLQHLSDGASSPESTQPAARRPGGQTAGQPGKQATRQLGNQATRQTGNQATRQPGGWTSPFLTRLSRPKRPQVSSGASVFRIAWREVDAAMPRHGQTSSDAEASPLPPGAPGMWRDFTQPQRDLSDAPGSSGWVLRECQDSSSGPSGCCPGGPGRKKTEPPAAAGAAVATGRARKKKRATNCSALNHRTSKWSCSTACLQ